jgi:hypothetical protein
MSTQQPVSQAAIGTAYIQEVIARTTVASLNQRGADQPVPITPVIPAES